MFVTSTMVERMPTRKYSLKKNSFIMLRGNGQASTTQKKEIYSKSGIYPAEFIQIPFQTRKQTIAYP